MARYHGIILGVLVLLSAANARAEISLALGPAFALEDEPVLVATADFNGDGLADVAAMTPGTNLVTVLFGDATRTLDGLRQVVIAPRLEAFTVGDVNADDRVDLVAVTNNNNSVFVSAGNGHGSFGPAARYDVGRRPVDVAVGDFDGARGNDLVVVARDDDQIRVLLNRGSGGFLPLTDIDVGNRPKRVVTADLNSDGLDDIIVLNSGFPNDDDISVLLNPGNGRFARQIRYGVGSRSKDLAVADVNNDGALDVLVLNGKPIVGSNANTFTVSVLLNTLEDRDGHPVASGALAAARDVFTPCPTSIAGIPLFCDPRRIAVADFDGDGATDFTVSFATLANVGTQSTPGVLTALRGFGDGSFAPGAQISVGTRPLGLASTDFNKDLIPDLAVAEEGTSSVRVVLAQQTTRQRPIGVPCTTAIECVSNFCTDGVCCASEACEAGQFCNLAGKEGRCRGPTAMPTPTGTPTPEPPGSLCPPLELHQCADGLFCVDARCCTTAVCPSGARCDVFGSVGQCAARLGLGQPCAQDTDCTVDLLCVSTGAADRLCAPAATTTPTPEPTETPSPVQTRTSGMVCTGDCCPGDCGGDRLVTVDELLTMVAISLGDTPASACFAGDVGGDGSVSVDDIVSATTSLLSGCAPEVSR